MSSVPTVRFYLIYDTTVTTGTRIVVLYSGNSITHINDYQLQILIIHKLTSVIPGDISGAVRGNDYVLVESDYCVIYSL